MGPGPIGTPGGVIKILVKIHLKPFHYGFKNVYLPTKEKKIPLLYVCIETDALKEWYTNLKYSAVVLFGTG